jgi:hypothetical protein
MTKVPRPEVEVPSNSKQTFGSPSWALQVRMRKRDRCSKRPMLPSAGTVKQFVPAPGNQRGLRRGRIAAPSSARPTRASVPGSGTAAGSSGGLLRENVAPARSSTKLDVRGGSMGSRLTVDGQSPELARGASMKSELAVGCESPTDGYSTPVASAPGVGFETSPFSGKPSWLGKRTAALPAIAVVTLAPCSDPGCDWGSRSSPGRTMGPPDGGT